RACHTTASCSRSRCPSSSASCRAPPRAAWMSGGYCASRWRTDKSVVLALSPRTDKPCRRSLSRTVAGVRECSVHALVTGPPSVGRTPLLFTAERMDTGQPAVGPEHRSGAVAGAEGGTHGPQRARLHVDRVTRGDSYNCHPGCNPVSSVCPGTREGAADHLREQHEAARVWPDDVRAGL